MHEGLTRKYAIAPNGIWWALQGEAHLRGFQMLFVRFAGCSVGCPGCDTDYSVARKMTVAEIIEEAKANTPTEDRDGWVWFTGGEPADRHMRPILDAFKAAGYSTAVATSGVKRFIPPVDWLSVSPHSSDPAKFQQRYGSEVKIVDGLNGLNLDEWHDTWDHKIDFMYRYVQPLWIGDVTTGYEDPESLKRCLDFLRRHPKWGLSRQEHKMWGVQ